MQTPRTKPRGGWTLIEVLVVAACLVTVMALTAPAVQSARSRSRTSQCKNNMKQLGLALHNYHDVFRTFPPGWISGDAFPDSGPRFGWQTSILPQMEEIRIYERIDSTKPMPPAKGDMKRAIAAYRCTSDPTPAVNPLRGGYGTSNYSGNSGNQSAKAPWLAPRRARFWPGQAVFNDNSNGIFWRNSACRLRDITDGTSHTFLVGERSAKSGAGIWPGVGNNAFVNDVLTDCSPGNELNSGYTAFSSYHRDGAHFLWCDGSVRFLNNDIEPKAYRELASRYGGQPVGDF